MFKESKTFIAYIYLWVENYKIFYFFLLESKTFIACIYLWVENYNIFYFFLLVCVISFFHSRPVLGI